MTNATRATDGEADMKLTERQLITAARRAASAYAAVHDLPKRKCPCSRVHKTALSDFIVLAVQTVVKQSLRKGLTAAGEAGRRRA